MPNSIGQFIAVLRKSNNLTQKELAERLGVSDKAVSRWERGENLPDLTLLPLIAQIFNVSTDELLRGEKNMQAPAPKRLQNTLFLGNVISIVLCAVGFIAALIASFSFERIYLAFFLALGFFLCASLCELVFVKFIFSQTKEDEEKRRVFLSACRTYVLLLILFSLCLPVSLMRSPIISKLPAATFPFFLIFPLSAALLGVVARFFAERIALQKGTLPSKNPQADDRLWRLRKITSIVALLLSGALLFAEVWITEDTTPLNFTKGKIFTFTEFAQFKEYIETGDTPSREHTLYDEEGNAFTYYHKNGDVRIVLNHKEGIKTWTHEAYARGEARKRALQITLSLAYPLEVVVLSLVYRKKREKLRALPTPSST